MLLGLFFFPNHPKKMGSTGRTMKNSLGHHGSFVICIVGVVVVVDVVDVATAVRRTLHTVVGKQTNCRIFGLKKG
jgi:hypothetical protein